MYRNGRIGSNFGNYGISTSIPSSLGVDADDSITLAMCPEKMLHTKPIDLRHICLFYLGHMYATSFVYIKQFS